MNEDKLARFKLWYENGSKLYVEVNRVNFIDYLRIVDEAQVIQYQNTNIDWHYRIWFFQGLVSFNASSYTHYYNSDIFMNEDGIYELAKLIIDDEHDYINIFQW
jgi:hypothetical protein